MNVHLLSRKLKLKWSKKAPQMDNESQIRKNLIVKMNNLLILLVQRKMETRTVKLQKSDSKKVKPQTDMQTNRSAMLIQHKMTKKSKIVPQEDDKSCQTTEYYESKMCSDKNVKKLCNQWCPEMNMQLPKPAVLYEYRRLCSDKDFQSTRCYKKRNYDKNCQSDDNLCYNK